MGVLILDFWNPAKAQMVRELVRQYLLVEVLNNSVWPDLR